MHIQITSNNKNNKKMNRIKRTITTLSLAAALITATAQTSEGGKTVTGGTQAFWNNVILELNAGAGTAKDGLSPLELGAKIGYRFIPRMYIFVHGGNTFGLYNEEHGQLYTKSATLGGGLGYTLWRHSNIDIDLRASAGSSIGNADWKQTVYDAGITFRIGRRSGIKALVGLGFRHASSRTAGIGTYNGFYGTVGFGF